MQYGFTKIRKGPEIDMYSHSGFIRGEEDGLSELRKRTKTPSKKNQNQAHVTHQSHRLNTPSFTRNYQPPMRMVSPTISTCVSTESYGSHGNSYNMTSSPSFHEPSHHNHAKRNAGRLTMLADAMIMMIQGAE